MVWTFVGIGPCRAAHARRSQYFTWFWKILYSGGCRFVVGTVSSQFGWQDLKRAEANEMMVAVTGYLPMTTEEQDDYCFAFLYSDRYFRIPLAKDTRSSLMGSDCSNDEGE